MKRCGKSAPRVRQRNRHGKPHREQNRIGTARRDVRREAITPQGDVRLAVRVGCSRQRANVVPEEWPSRIVRHKRAVPYRTRLTGRLMFSAKALSEKTRLTENEGFGLTRRTPRQFQGRSVTIFCSNAVSASGAVTFGESISRPASSTSSRTGRRHQAMPGCSHQRVHLLPRPPCRPRAVADEKGWPHDVSFLDREPNAVRDTTGPSGGVNVARQL